MPIPACNHKAVVGQKVPILGAYFSCRAQYSRDSADFLRSIEPDFEVNFPVTGSARKWVPDERSVRLPRGCSCKGGEDANQ